MRAQQQKRAQCWLCWNPPASQPTPTRRTRAVMLRGLNVSSKTMNRNLNNGYAIALGRHHCSRVRKLRGHSFLRPPATTPRALSSRKGHRIDYRSAGLATLIRSGDGTRGRNGRRVSPEMTQLQGSGGLAWHSRQFRDGGSAVAASEYLASSSSLFWWLRCFTAGLACLANCKLVLPRALVLNEGSERWPASFAIGKQALNRIPGTAETPRPTLKPQNASFVSLRRSEILASVKEA
jgi:hypothetical protein